MFVAENVLDASIISTTQLDAVPSTWICWVFQLNVSHKKWLYIAYIHHGFECCCGVGSTDMYTRITRESSTISQAGITFFSCVCHSSSSPSFLKTINKSFGTIVRQWSNVHNIWTLKSKFCLHREFEHCDMFRSEHKGRLRLLVAVPRKHVTLWTDLSSVLILATDWLFQT